MRTTFTGTSSNVFVGNISGPKRTVGEHEPNSVDDGFRCSFFRLRCFSLPPDDKYVFVRAANRNVYSFRTFRSPYERDRFTRFPMISVSPRFPFPRRMKSRNRKMTPARRLWVGGGYVVPSVAEKRRPCVVFVSVVDYGSAVRPRRLYKPLREPVRLNVRLMRPLQVARRSTTDCARRA